MRFNDLPVDFVEKLATNAGIMLTDFTPATGAYSTADILFANHSRQNWIHTVHRLQLVNENFDTYLLHFIFFLLFLS